MAHAATIKTPYYHRYQPRIPDIQEEIPPRAKVYYVLIVTAILAAAIGFIVVLGINGSLYDQPNTTPQQTNTTSPGVTKDTGAPSQSTGTPSDRTTPSPAGGGGNTLLNPDF